MKTHPLIVGACSLAVLGLGGCEITEIGTGYGTTSYGRGYHPGYGYAPAPRYYGGHYGGYRGYDDGYGISRQSRQRAAYKLGRRAGVNDFHAGRRKQYGRHSALYDRSTEEAFKQGHYSGYEEARERARDRD